MMTRKLRLLLTSAEITFLDFAHSAPAQSVKGKLIDNENSPLKGATITAKENYVSDLSDEAGLFLLTGLNHGKQTILISYVGLTATERKASLKVGDTLDIGIIELNSDSKILQTVEITGRKEKTYKNNVSF